MNEVLVMLISKKVSKLLGPMPSLADEGRLSKFAS